MFCVGSRARRRIKTPSLTPPVSRLRGCVRLQTRHRRRLWCRLRCPQGATGQGIEAPGVSWRLSHHVARDRARHRLGDGWSAYATHRPVCCALRFLLNSCGWTGGGCGPVSSASRLGTALCYARLFRWLNFRSSVKRARWKSLIRRNEPRTRAICVAQPTPNAAPVANSSKLMLNPTTGTRTCAVAQYCGTASTVAAKHVAMRCGRQVVPSADTAIRRRGA